MIKHIRFVPTLSPPRFRLARRYHPSVPVCTQQVPTPPEKRNRKPRCPACVRERAREVTVLRVSVGVCSNSQDPARSAPTSPPPIPFQSGRVTGLGQVKEASFLVSPPRRSAANQDLSVSPQHRSVANVSKRRSPKGHRPSRRPPVAQDFHSPQGQSSDYRQAGALFNRL